jgi:hypothetical protein
VTLELTGDRTSLIPGFSGPIPVTGALDARGLVERCEVRGRVHAGSLATRYELELTSSQGRPLRLLGERRTKLTDPLFSSSTVRAELLDESGRALAKLVLRLDYRQRLARYLTL